MAHSAAPLSVRSVPDLERSYGFHSWHCRPELMAMPHRHSDIEINFVLHGEICYLHRDREIRIPSDRLAIFWAAIPHQLIDRPTACDFAILTIPLEVFVGWKLPHAFTQALLWGEMLLDATPSAAALDRLLFPCWHEDLANGRARLALREIEARLWRLAEALAAEPAERPAERPAEEEADGLEIRTVPAPNAKAHQMARFIVEHYAAPLSVAQVAGAVNLHPSYAMACFKKTFRMTVLDYILHFRVTQAQRLLATTEQSVLEIALQTGFNSTSSFYAAFRRYAGYSPRYYRQSVS
jgi:AraC-like DNA-binding protein